VELRDRVHRHARPVVRPERTKQRRKSQKGKVVGALENSLSQNQPQRGLFFDISIFVQDFGAEV
jgi:hypothetical protein